MVAIFAAVDLGASGGRVMRGTVAGDSVQLEPVHRFANGVVERDGHLRWDATALFREVEAGLAQIPEATSIGIDTWGVDYARLDASGALLAEPIAYRDDRTAKVIDAVHARISPADLYATTGIQHLPFNTIYQLAADRQDPHWADTDHVVLLPDLVAYWLTGVLGTEVTNASTTGLLDARTRQWAEGVFARLDLAPELFPPLQSPGEMRGTTADGRVVTAVGSHDTASAVLGVPATTEHFAYIASGTWSLVGVELEGPVLTAAARDANFTNEAGVDGRTRFLRNVGGLWLLQECVREWGRVDLTDLLAAAAKLPAGGPRIDVDDAAFIAPGDMPNRIARAAGRSMRPPELTRCILDSLADAYARAVETASRLSGKPVEVIHIVGGGSQNDLLCRLTADATQLPLLAGPVEATAFGNVLVQARAHGAPSSPEALRRQLAAAVTLRSYESS